MPEGSQKGSQRSLINTDKWPSSPLSGLGDKMMSSDDRGDSSSCTSVNTVSSDSDHPTSLSSSTSSVSLQEASLSSSSSSSSSSSLPYAAELSFNVSSSSSMQKRNSSDISLDLRPLETGGQEVQNGRDPSPPSTRQLSLLERVVLEIVETEQAYVRDLKSIVEDYLGPIVDCKSLPLSSEDVSTLFCNIEDIYEFNRELLEDLRRSRHAAAIAECFVERSEDFDIYTLYCMNYPNCVSLLRQCLKNDIVFRFLNEKQTSLNQSLPVETYLLKPVQRILKYHLLLQELSRHVDPSDPDFEVVEEALVTMTAVAWYINDMKRRQELSIRLKEIEGLLVNWSGPELAGFGDLLLEGSFRVQKVKKERAYFLFEKILLITKKKLHQFVYSSHIFCCNLSLEETLKDPLSFRVWDQNILKQQHTVQTRNQEEKRLWVHFLKKVMVENHPASLPHKARRLLGNQCVSTLSDLEHRSSPGLDHSAAHQRSRRHSEPQDLLLSTPERGRRGRHLLLDRTLSHRHCRRQSDPADLKQSNSETNLHQASTAAGDVTSRVFQLRVEPSGDQQREQEEEDLTYMAPPTLSITEEILEIINQQTRTRENPKSPPEPAVLEQLEPGQDSPKQVDMTTLLETVTTDHDMEDEGPAENHHLQIQASDSVDRSGSVNSCQVTGESNSLVEEQVGPSESATLTTALPKDQRQDTDPETSNNSTHSMHELAVGASQLDQIETQEVRPVLRASLSRDDEGPSVDQVLLERSSTLSESDCENKCQTEIKIPAPDDPNPEIYLTFLPGQPEPTDPKPTTQQLIEDSGSAKQETGALESNKENIDQEVPEKQKMKVQGQADVETKSGVEGQAEQDWTQIKETKQDCGSSQAKTVPRVTRECLGSYLEGIRLFESSTTSDPAVVQNSERILNRVQTLARMYSSRNAALKVPLNKRPWETQSPAFQTHSDPDPLMSKTGTQTNKTHNQHQNQTRSYKNQILRLSPEVPSPDGQQGSVSRLPAQQKQRATLSRPRDFLTLIPASCTDLQRLQSQSWSQRKTNVASTDPRELAAKKLHLDSGCRTQNQPPWRVTSNENQKDLKAFAAPEDLTKSHTQAALVFHELPRMKEKPTSPEATRGPQELPTLPDLHTTREHCFVPQDSSCREPDQSDLWSSQVLAGSHAPPQLFSTAENRSFSRGPSALPSRLNTFTKPSVPPQPSTFTRSLAASFISQSINQSIAKRNSGQNLTFNAPSVCQQAATVEQQHQGLMPGQALPSPTLLSRSDSRNSNPGTPDFFQVEQDYSNLSGQVTTDPVWYQVALPCPASKNTSRGHTPIKSTPSVLGTRNPHYSCNRTESLPEQRGSSAQHLHGPTVEPHGIRSFQSLSPHPIGLPPLSNNIAAPQPKRFTTLSLSGSHLTHTKAPPAPGSPPSRGQFMPLHRPTSTIGQDQREVGFISLMGGSPDNSLLYRRTNPPSPSLQLDTGVHIGGDPWKGAREMLSSPELQEQHLDEGHCRSQVICPYIMRSCQEKTTSPLPGKASTHLDHIQQPDEHSGTAHSPANSSKTSTPAFSRQAIMRASYATTVNLQITSRGCITSFSTAHLSLSQNLPGNKSAETQKHQEEP